MKSNSTLRLLALPVVVILLAMQVHGQKLTQESAVLTLKKVLAHENEKLLPIYPPGHVNFLFDVADGTVVLKDKPTTKTKKSSFQSGPVMSLFVNSVPERQYRAIDLGTLPGSPASWAAGINEHGHVIGESQSGMNTAVNGFLYKDRVMINIGTLSGGIESIPRAINDNGLIVGYADKGTAREYYPFLYSNGSMQEIATFAGGWGGAEGINSGGHIVGNDFMFINAPTNGYRYYASSITGLGTLGGSSAEVHGINASGQMCGYSYITGNSAQHAYLHSEGVMEDIDAGGNTFSRAFSINDLGQVVGYLNRGSTDSPFVYADGVMEVLDLGASAYAWDINNLGEIVGSKYVGNGQNRGYIYSNGSAKDLNDVVVGLGSGLVVTEAKGINDKGQIAVTVASSTPGWKRAYLLDPLPSGWREAISTTPSAPIYGVCAAKGVGKNNLILATHGWNPDLQWLESMTNCLQQYVTAQSLTSWQVTAYKWENNASTGVFPSDAQEALENGKKEGKVLGDCIASQGWTHVHLIAHSAGAALIQAISDRVKLLSPSTTVHCTFLDPFVGTDYAGIAQYGKGAEWAENYFSRDAKTRFGDWVTESPFTESLLTHAHNVDVTQLDPHKIVGAKFRSSVTGQMEPCVRTYTTHRWPVTFYTNTIVGGVNGDYASYGFPLSREAGGWNSGVPSYQRGNDPAVILGTPDPTCVTDIQVIPPAYVNTLIDFTQSPTIESETGTIQKWFKSIKLFSGSPAWLATVVSSTNPVNIVSFDTQFTSTNGAWGLLSVLWDDQVIGTIDERIAITNHYTFRFPNAGAHSGHVLGFRLDPFTNLQSVVIVTNIALNQIGVSKQFSLSFTGGSTNGIPIQQLTAEAGFDYHVQSSSNLVDWIDIVVLANTNGTVRFFDQSATNSPGKFYRGVAPY